MQQINTFVAIDGTLFHSDQECLAHEAYLNVASRIDDFIINLAPSERRESEYRRVLTEYEKFCATYAEPELCNTVPDGTEQDQDLG